MNPRYCSRQNSHYIARNYDDNYRAALHTYEPRTAKGILKISKRRVIIALVIGLIAFSFTFEALAGIDILDTAIRAVQSGFEQTTIARTSKSTPVSQWKRGDMPYLYQTDAAWGNEEYAGGTIATHGCGPTALSMAYIFLTGRTGKDPATLSRLAENAGYVDSGYTSWTFMKKGAESIGLKSHELPANKEAVLAQLKMGHPIICSVGPGDFTTDGHFIVLQSVDSDGKILIRDPNSEERSRKTWQLSQILPQCRNLWALSV